MLKRLRLDLQAKVVVVLVAVILPTFVVVTIAENKFTQPFLDDEIRQIGVNSARALAADLVSSRVLGQSNPTPAVENSIQELLYSQPNIVRMDVAIKDPVTGLMRLVGSSVEDEPGVAPPLFNPVENVVSEFKTDEVGLGFWDISVPIEQRSRDPRGPRRLLGLVHVNISTKLVARVAVAIWRTTVAAAALSVVLLVVLLSYFLRKTINNDRALKRAESQNLQLTEQLHDIQRQLMNSEKLAVMGQLTASFAHEIGTPLNAIGGHLQLLGEEVSATAISSTRDRLEIIQGQLSKIEEIVKGFLQSTAKPTSQRQLVDMNQIADKTLGLLRPRIEAMGVEVRRGFDRSISPVRMVPLELEQILLNLMNNSLDSLSSKRNKKGFNGNLTLKLETSQRETEGRHWTELEVYDSGEGIKKLDLQKVLKPFFTTKPPGEGTGLGLAICQQLAHKYGGELEIDSKEGAWTRVTLRVPV